MKLEIIETRKNPLLKREEVILDVVHVEGPTPSKDDIRKKYAAEKTIKLERVETVFIKSGFGHTTSKAYLKVWDKEQEHLRVVEEKPKENENTAEAVPAQTAPKEAQQSEEKPKDETLKASPDAKVEAQEEKPKEGQ